MGPYSHKIWYNTSRKKPYAHSSKANPCSTDCLGICGTLHGVPFLNRCSMEYVLTRHYKDFSDEMSNFGSVCLTIGEMKKNNLLAGYYNYHDIKYKDVAP